MPRLPRITGEELVKALEKEGFEVVRQRGSHMQMRKFIEGDKRVNGVEAVISNELCVMSKR